jgi:ABC-type glycerol-3-phosphate transport system substrate-binding protein
VRTPRGLLAIALLVVALSLTACGSDTTATPSGDGSSPSATDNPVIKVAITGDTVTPNGDRVAVQKGQDVTLEVTADAPGEIHVHSTPEQELEYDAGTTTLVIKGLDRPGVVDVESHALEKTIVQLEVS